MVLIAAGLLALVPIVAQPLLSLSVKAFDRVSVGAFERVERSGEVAGRLYAISTFGSLSARSRRPSC
jgi:hypothetical protein